MIGAEPDGIVCSRAGCGSDATWLVEWRNPRIHPVGRTKTWAACDAHVEYLRDFVAARSFPVAVRPLDTLQGAS